MIAGIVVWVGPGKWGDSALQTRSWLDKRPLMLVFGRLLTGQTSGNA